MITAQAVVDLLNQLTAADAAALARLIDRRTRIHLTAAQADALPVVVAGPEHRPTLGMLGILNGIASLDGGAVIEAVYDDRTTKLTGFRLRG